MLCKAMGLGSQDIQYVDYLLFFFFLSLPKMTMGAYREHANTANSKFDIPNPGEAFTLVSGFLSFSLSYNEEKL